MKPGTIAALCAILFASTAAAEPAQTVEPKPPSAEGQTPAFPQQTRAPLQVSGVKFQVRTVAKGLEFPWGLALLPDGRMLVTERPGRIRLVTDGKLSEPLEGPPAVHTQAISGMLDIAIDPKFAANHLVYWSYVEARATGSGTTVARGRLVDGEHPALADVQVIYRQVPDLETTHSNYGGRLLFARDGALFLTLGDRDEMKWRPLIQQMDNGVGKLVRIRTDGSPAPGDPFLHSKGVRPEIWASGFRNPLGVALDPRTGELWLTDVGPRGGDELDHIRRGRNYGWPVIGYGKEYSGQRVGDGTVKAGYEQPAYYWDPVISPSSLAFYEGAAFPAWKGSVFVTSLSQRHLARLALKGDKVVGEERLLADLEERLRLVKPGPDGSLYLLTDNAEGRILQLVPAE